MSVPDPMLPAPFRIQKVRRELADTFTLDLTSSADSKGMRFAPGQFNMLYMFGMGEVPISISGDPRDSSRLVHTLRAVGPVTEAIYQLKRGDSLGVRGPFGTIWPVQQAAGSDIVFIGGGIGLAPLRPAIYHVLANREQYGNICLLYGARTPEDILYRDELEKWRGRFDVTVSVTVDRATGKWGGKVGVVTRLVAQSGFDPLSTVALICGPEIMIRYSIMALNEQGVTNERIYVSMERNMKCAVGFCGHCQFGPTFVCRDGPVFRYDQIEHLFMLREL